jgi:hypothetical protein
MQLELEKRISEMPDSGFDDANEHQSIKIAQITLAYENRKVIKLLETRGNYVKSENWAKVDSTNKQIHQEIKD